MGIDNHLHNQPLARMGAVGRSVMLLLAYASFVFLPVILARIPLERLPPIVWILLTICFLISVPLIGWTHLKFYSDRLVLLRWLWGTSQVVRLDDVVDIVEPYGRFNGLKLTYMKGDKLSSKVFATQGLIRSKMTREQLFSSLGLQMYTEYRGMLLRHWVNPKWAHLTFPKKANGGKHK